MNKKRRKELWTLKKRLLDIIKMDSETANIENVHLELEDIRSELECLYYEEESYMDNIPENLQESIRYYAAERACDNLDDASYSIEDAINDDDWDSITKYINTAINYIDNATM